MCLIVLLSLCFLVSEKNFFYRALDRIFNFKSLRPQSINCLASASFAIKNEVGGRVKAKEFGFFEKNICILPVAYVTSSAK